MGEPFATFNLYFSCFVLRNPIRMLPYPVEIPIHFKYQAWNTNATLEWIHLCVPKNSWFPPQSTAREACVVPGSGPACGLVTFLLLFLHPLWGMSLGQHKVFLGFLRVKWSKGERKVFYPWSALLVVGAALMKLSRFWLLKNKEERTLLINLHKMVEIIY